MSSRSLRTTATASLVVAALLAAMGCSSQADEPERRTGTARSGETTTTITDAPLRSLKGTTDMPPVPESFQRTLEETDPNVAALANAAMRPYDAVMVTALAAEMARSDAPARIAAEIVASTDGGERCTTFRTCRALTDVLSDFDYQGVSGFIDLMKSGQSSDGTFVLSQFDAHQRLNVLGTRSADVPDEAAALPTPDPLTGPAADGAVKIAMVYPTSGSSAQIAAAARAGVRLAVTQVNDAGGVLGRPIELLDGDTGDGNDAATKQAAQAMVSAGADVVIGGTTDNDGEALIDPVAGAGAVLLSTSVTGSPSTAAALSGLFFRLNPPGWAQAYVLAGVAAEDGFSRVAAFASGPAAQASLDQFADRFSAFDGEVGSATVVDGNTAAATIQKAAADGQADAIVILGDQSVSGHVIASLIAGGNGPTTVATYVANIAATLPEAVR